MPNPEVIWCAVCGQGTIPETRPKKCGFCKAKVENPDIGVTREQANTIADAIIARWDKAKR